MFFVGCIMGNKYKQQSDEAQKERVKIAMCLKKKQFETEEKAFKKNQDAYKCPHCEKWHRTGARTRFINKVRGKR